MTRAYDVMIQRLAQIDAAVDNSEAIRTLERRELLVMTRVPPSACRSMGLHTKESDDHYRKWADSELSEIRQTMTLIMPEHRLAHRH